MGRESCLQGTPAPRWTCAEAEKRVDSWHRLSRCAVKGEGWARPPGPRRRGTATQGTGSAEGPGGGEGLAGSRRFHGKERCEPPRNGKRRPRRPRKAPAHTPGLAGRQRSASSSGPSLSRADSLGGASAALRGERSAERGRGEPSGGSAGKRGRRHRAVPLGGLLLKEERGAFEFTSSSAAQRDPRPLPTPPGVRGTKYSAAEGNR